MGSLKVLRDILDIAIVAYVLYRLMLLLKGTRAVELLKGLAVLFLASVISYKLGFNTIHWIMKNITTMILVALPLVFHPELRRALEKLGRGQFFGYSFFRYQSKDLEETIKEIVEATFILAQKNWGALLVMERETGLNDYLEESIPLDSLISTELLLSIFTPNGPLHDGAAIIRGDRVVAASCLLPLTEKAHLSSQYGTRHRAALGMAENSDALIIVVSEETGFVSMAFGQKLIRYLDKRSLQDRLFRELQDKGAEENVWHKIVRWGRKLDG